MSTAIADRNETVVARPLKVLVPLIHKDWNDAKEASERAAQPYYESIGQKLIEAKSQLNRGEFLSWVKRNFKFGEDQAQKYIRLANTTSDTEIPRARPASMSEALREIGQSPRGAARGGASWHEPVKEALDRAANIRNLHEESLKREAEREAQRRLGLQLIDIGFKALASQLHPDKPGGSKEAMTRLNAVRDRLKMHV